MSDYQLPELDLDTLKRLTTIVVERQGRDFAYNTTRFPATCYYVPINTSNPEDPKGRSGCLIGEILKEHGVSVETLSVFNVEMTARHVLMMLKEDNALYVRPSVIDVMMNMQIEQDHGATWGVVLDFLMRQ